MSTINDIGIPGVGNGILQPKLKHKWRVTFTNIGGGNGQTGVDVSLQATQVDRPKLSHDEVEIHRYNSRIWVAGKHSFETINLTVEDDIAGKASQVINDQMQTQQFLIGAEGQFLASAAEGSLYKFTTYLDLLDGNDQVVEKWAMEGCWIQAVDWGDLDYAAVADQVTIQLTLRFDHAVQKSINGYSGAGAALGGAAI